MCGDGLCNGQETCNTCALDCGPCGPVCGDSVCNGAETCSSCALDCGPCPNNCSHDLCLEGVALVAGCDPCVTQVCAADSFCCTDSWDSMCVGEVTSICGQSCGGGSCAHDECTIGVALDPNCSPCVAVLCGAFDPLCCSAQWDDFCVIEASVFCGLPCP